MYPQMRSHLVVQNMFKNEGTKILDTLHFLVFVKTKYTTGFTSAVW